MKKKWLALGLVSLLGVGMFVACDEADTNGKVTAEQWNVQMNNLDLSHVFIDDKFVIKGADGKVYETWDTYTTINGDAMYVYDYDVWLRYDREKEEWVLEKDQDEIWCKKINDVYYEYRSGRYYDEDGWSENENTSWQEVMYENGSKLENAKEEIAYTLQSFELYYKMGISAFTHDEQKGVYTMEVSTSETSIKMEIKFVDEKLYSIDINTVTSAVMGYEIPNVTVEATHSITFIEKDIEFLAQDKLESLAKSVEAKEGVYYFNNIKEYNTGLVHGIGDNYDGVRLTEETMVVTLNKDGTATRSQSGVSSVCTWKETNGKIVLTGSDFTMTLTKKGSRLMYTNEKGGVVSLWRE